MRVEMVHAFWYCLILFVHVCALLYQTSAWTIICPFKKGNLPIDCLENDNKSGDAAVRDMISSMSLWWNLLISTSSRSVDQTPVPISNSNGNGSSETQQPQLLLFQKLHIYIYLHNSTYIHLRISNPKKYPKNLPAVTTPFKAHRNVPAPAHRWPPPRCSRSPAASPPRAAGAARRVVGSAQALVCYKNGWLHRNWDQKWAFLKQIDNGPYYGHMNDVTLKHVGFVLEPCPRSCYAIYVDAFCVLYCTFCGK